MYYERSLAILLNNSQVKCIYLVKPSLIHNCKENWNEFRRKIAKKTYKHFQLTRFYSVRCVYFVECV